MALSLKKYVQYQKPMAAVLTACAAPVLMGVYNFGWRVAASVAWCCLVCWIAEYLFVRKDGKPVSMAAFVTGTLLALCLPPNVPFWMLAVGCAFSIVFGKMVFGGFGKNVFNPALTGRCFLYIMAPAFIATSWYAPASGQAGGFTRWTVTAENDPVDEFKTITDQNSARDIVSGATTFAAVKKLGKEVATAKADPSAASKTKDINTAFDAVDLEKLFLGRISGSQGETSALLILLGLVYLIYKKAVKWQLVAGPVIGMFVAMLIINFAGAMQFPFAKTMLMNLFGGGTMFAIVFMTTEPVTAPMNGKARWIYGVMIGVLAAVIRTFSVFNAGLMFSILIGNMFAPIIEIACNEYDAWRKAKGA